MTDNKTKSRAMRIAKRELLIKANGYEPRKRKWLRNVSFKEDADGIFATWIGEAHNYSVYVKFSNLDKWER